MSFLLSFLPPRDAVTALKAACDCRTKGEDGPELRPLTSGNVILPALFEACCESPPCWHLSGPQIAYFWCSGMNYCSLQIAARFCYTQDLEGGGAMKYLSPLKPWTDCSLIELISQVASFILHIFNLTSFCLIMPFPWHCPIQNNSTITIKSTN